MAGTQDRPRVAPLERADADEWQAELLDGLGPAADMHLFRTLAVHPRLMRSWLPFGGRLLYGGLLSDRDRELVILRTAARCGCDYEWGQHVAIARAAGLRDEEILAAGAADAAPEVLTARDAALLRATDQLVAEHDLDDATWAGLADGRSDAEVLEVTMLAGHYAMLAGMMRAARVTPEVPMPAVGRVDVEDARSDGA